MRNIISFHVKGRPYALKYRSKILYDLTKQSGKTVFDLLQDPFGGWPEVLKAGLLTDHPDLTLGNVASLIDGFVADRDYSELGKLIRKALEEAGMIPRDEDVDAEASAEGKAQAPNTPLEA